jgi:Protein-tyrosine-phosphatase-like, N-terminal domain
VTLGNDEPALDHAASAVTYELSREFEQVAPPDAVRAAVRESFESLATAPIKTYIPILARRIARERLRDRFVGQP